MGEKGILIPSGIHEFIVTFDETNHNSMEVDEGRTFEQLRIDPDGTVLSMIQITVPQEEGTVGSGPPQIQELRFDAYNYPIIVRGKLVNKGNNTITKDISDGNYVIFQAHERKNSEFKFKAIKQNTVIIGENEVFWFDYVYIGDRTWTISGQPYIVVRSRHYGNETESEVEDFWNEDDSTEDDSTEDDSTEVDSTEVDSTEVVRPPPKKQKQSHATSSTKWSYRLKM